MTAADRLDRYRAQALLGELERLAAREREVRDEISELLGFKPRPDNAVCRTLRERFGGKPTP